MWLTHVYEPLFHKLENTQEMNAFLVTEPLKFELERRKFDQIHASLTEIHKSWVSHIFWIYFYLNRYSCHYWLLIDKKFKIKFEKRLKKYRAFKTIIAI